MWISILQSRFLATVVASLVLLNSGLSMAGTQTDANEATSNTSVQRVESNGITIAIDAFEAGLNQAIIEISVSDTAGFHRLTANTEIDIAFIEPSQNYGYEIEKVVYDDILNTIRYRITLTTAEDLKDRPISFVVERIRYNGFQDDICMDLDLSNEISNGQNIGKSFVGTGRLPDDLLTAGFVSSIPGTESNWLSAIGINCGYLTIQVGESADSRNPGARIRPYLLDPDGNRIASSIAAGSRIDNQNNIIENTLPAEFRVVEYYFFPVSGGYADYSLCFSTSNRAVISGNWPFQVQ